MSSLMENVAEKYTANITLVKQKLTEAVVDVEYEIQSIETDDDDLRNFLFSLGCYKGETITVISILSENYVVSVKDARYSIDADLANAIWI